MFKVPFYVYFLSMLEYKTFCVISIHVESMSYPCQIHVKSMSNPWQNHVLSMSYPCPIHVLSMSCPCPIHVLSDPGVTRNHDTFIWPQRDYSVQRQKKLTFWYCKRFALLTLVPTSSEFKNVSYCDPSGSKWQSGSIT